MGSPASQGPGSLPLLIPGPRIVIFAHPGLRSSFGGSSRGSNILKTLRILNSLCGNTWTVLGVKVGIRQVGPGRGGESFGRSIMTVFNTFNDILVKTPLKPRLFSSFRLFSSSRPSSPGPQERPEGPTGGPSKLPLLTNGQCMTARCTRGVQQERCTGRLQHLLGIGGVPPIGYRVLLHPRV